MFKTETTKNFYKVTKVFNIFTQEIENVNIVTDEKGLSNIIVNGYEIEEYTIEK